MSYTLHTGDALSVLRSLPENSVHCCVTSPPYWGLRRYVAKGSPEEQFQIGLEPTLEGHIDRLVEVFREVRRVLSSDGTFWMNYGSMYSSDGGSGTGGGKLRVGRTFQQKNERVGVAAGYKSKDLILADALLAIALQKDGWYLRSEIIWQKPTAMPESAKDRPMRDHEKVFLFSKSERYAYDNSAVRIPVTGNAHSRGKGVNQKCIKFPANWAKGSAVAHSSRELKMIRQNDSWSAAVRKTVTDRQLRTVWSITAQPCKQAHFATFPVKLAERCILLATKKGDAVLDPCSGAGSTGIAALRNGRSYIGVELNSDYNQMARERIEHERWLWEKQVSHG